MWLDIFKTTFEFLLRIKDKTEGSRYSVPKDGAANAVPQSRVLSLVRRNFYGRSFFSVCFFGVRLTTRRPVTSSPALDPTGTLPSTRFGCTKIARLIPSGVIAVTEICSMCSRKHKDGDRERRNKRLDLALKTSRVFCKITP